MDENLEFLRNKYPKATWSIGHVEEHQYPVFEDGDDTPSRFDTHTTVFYSAENGLEGEDHRAFPVIAELPHTIDENTDLTKADEMYEAMFADEFIGNAVILAK